MMDGRHFLALVLAAVLTGCAAATPPPGRVERPDVSNMLEGALAAVVTVAIQTIEDAPAVFGFTRSDDPEDVGRSRAATAYARPLDLSPYAGKGSGFVIQRDGRFFVVTNAHVIDEADPDEIYAFSIDRRRYTMRLRGADTFRDVAVLEFVEPPGGEIASIPIHTAADLRIGTPVFAVGNPLGEFPYSVTSGIVSGLNRTLGGLSGKIGYLQTDATLIWGNSGGPLIGPEGDVVGLNTRIHLLPLFIPVPAPQINFALEGRHLSRIVDDLIRAGRVERPFLGLVLQVEDRETDEDGVPIRITGTIPGSPAAGMAGQLEGARLLAINDESVLSLQDVSGMVEMITPGSSVRLRLEQGRESREVALTAAVLDDAEATRLGGYLAEQLFRTSLVEVEGGATGRTVTVSRSAPPPAHMEVFIETPDTSFVTSDPPQRGETLTHAGFYGEELVLWRVNEVKDLGAIGRMVLPTGRFLMAYEAGDAYRIALVEIQPSLLL